MLYNQYAEPELVKEILASQAKWFKRPHPPLVLTHNLDVTIQRVL